MGKKFLFFCFYIEIKKNSPTSTTERHSPHGTIPSHHPHCFFSSSSFPTRSSIVKFFEKSVNSRSRIFLDDAIDERKLYFFPTRTRSLKTLKNSLDTHPFNHPPVFSIHFHRLSSFFLRKNLSKKKNMFTPSISTCLKKTSKFFSSLT